ncbi:hypothetical protein D0856_05020 [Vibrio owensii]|nr:hypothetical protein D0856_05020 [Vibrio owensii]
MFLGSFKCKELTSTNKAFKSDSQRLAFSLRSSIAKRRSHLNAALVVHQNSSSSSNSSKYSGE